ncbi:MAG: cytochrome c3 family protein [Acidobacteriota bacterium]
MTSTPTVLACLALTCLAAASGLPAIGGTGEVAASLHNLSVSGPGEVRALNETGICKFCHIPHNAIVPEPLWGHALSAVQHYETSRLRTGKGGFAPAPQPDGSSRLCLSCHDGTVALGEIAGEPRTVRMAGAQRLGRGRRGHLGTDLSGSHPISFVVPDGDRAVLGSDADIGLRSLSVIQADKAVRLDDHGKMQCTTCHDAHADRYYQPGRVPRFWVKPTVGEVCLTCHELR